MYQISITPYPDSRFLVPYSGNVTLEMNQQLYIAVKVDEFDSNQIALVLDTCWATPVNQMDFYIHWDLINNEWDEIKIKGKLTKNIDYCITWTKE